MIPEHLFQDRYWRGLLHIFTNHNKLKQFLSNPDFFDFEELSLHVEALLKASKGWSPCEKFMLEVALHLFNGINKIDLSQADRLDNKSTEILREALLLRLDR
ncbi:MULTISPECIES: hypothetical protein [unclassified Paenibacillus]|uniref:hypothetical protein n=1 Tax=unclassified Paenibacillus TaxID=185978 RepID=UPI0004F8FFE4|nr:MULTISPECIES: hypothetical protein [unclassified Paenibacillus]AIQ26940.1 hypothetical protein P40081_00990 [Paenibacillus sp. FSL P4-0081]OMF28325.1 hypothetical protein BK132_14820 [Paenibacillus sp. FSL H8-0259]